MYRKGKPETQGRERIPKRLRSIYDYENFKIKILHPEIGMKTHTILPSPDKNEERSTNKLR